MTPKTGPDLIPFKISARLIDLFGRELITRNEVALAELIKNSYDSDATKVVMEFEQVRQKGGTLRITDDGDGMSLEDLKTKWMLVGTRDKLEHPITARRRRRKVGEKGIGRLGVHKLANRTVLRTKNRGARNWTVLDIDWTKYQTDNSFEQVAHPCWEEPGEVDKRGTIIELLGLRDKFVDDSFQRLQSELALLVPPLPGMRGFRIEIKSKEFPRYKGDIQTSLLDAATYTLDATFDGHDLLGILKVRGKKTPINVIKKVDAEHCGPVKIGLYVYIFKKESFQGTPIQLSKVQKMMEVYKGVRIYRDGFKVGNYGESGNDWLDIAGGHVRRHEVVLHPKQVLGTVHITRDGNPDLTELTNREGFVQNEAFNDFVTVCKQAIELINEQRWAERRERELSKKVETPLGRALDRLEKTAEKSRSISEGTRKKLSNYVRAAKRQEQTLSNQFEEELQMYRNLASLGISTAAFAHDTEAIGLDLDVYVRGLGQKLKGLPDEYAKKLIPDFENVQSAIQRSVHLVDLLLDYVRQKQQRPIKIAMEFVIRRVLERYKPFLEKADIRTEVVAETGLPTFRGVPMDWEAVCINLITNAAWALRKRNKPEPRLLRFEIKHSQHEILLSVSDTGPGIARGDAERIFLPFVTTKGEKGIGLGLTIVRDTIENYGGSIKIVSPGTLGGATFEIIIPIRARIKST